MPNGYGPHCDSDDSDLGEDRPPTPPTPFGSPALRGATRDTRGDAPIPKALPRLRGSVAVAMGASPTVKPEPESDEEVMPGAAALFDEHRAPSVPPPIGPGPGGPKPSRAPQAQHYKAPRQKAPKHQHARVKAPKHNRVRIIGEVPGPLPPPWGPRTMDTATCDISRTHPKHMKFMLKTMSFVHGRFGAPWGRYCRVCAKFLALDY